MKNGVRGAYTILSSGGWWNQRLLKDCGIIPYLLHKNYGFNSVLVGYNEKIPDLPYLDTYLKGVKMEFLPDDSLETRIKYIDSHSEDMDLFILYGAYPIYMPLVDYYRLKRPDGKVYLATDANTGWMDRIEHDTPQWKKFLSQCDVIAASCRKTQRYLSMKWPAVIDLIRNGWYNFANVNFDNLYELKEDIILTVGRIGTPQKNNAMLLEAFAACSDSIPNWHVRLVGNVDPKFKIYIDDFFSRYPKLKGRVDFVGIVEDKAQLAEEFKKAKIFALTSTFEGGTPNVIAEALYAGCYIISSDIDAASDAVGEGNCGCIVPLNDVAALAEAFKRVCTASSLITRGGVFAFNYAREYFDAEKNVDRLYYMLYNMEKI